MVTTPMIVDDCVPAVRRRAGGEYGVALPRDHLALEREPGLGPGCRPRCRPRSRRIRGQTHLPKLLDRVARGERITITRRGKLSFLTCWTAVT